MLIADSRFSLIVVVCSVKALTAGGTVKSKSWYFEEYIPAVMEYGTKSECFDSELQWF